MLVNAGFEFLFLSANVTFKGIQEIFSSIVNRHVVSEHATIQKVIAAVEAKHDFQVFVLCFMMRVEIEEAVLVLRADDATEHEVFVVIFDVVVQTSREASGFLLAVLANSLVWFSRMELRQMLAHVDDIVERCLALTALPVIVRP